MLFDLMNALAFLTVLPVPWTAREDSPSPGHIFAYFPLVGLIIGAILALGAMLAAKFRFLPSDVVSFLVLLVWVGLTGGLHLDGLADSCDGLLATTEPERRLEIMKDPRAGSWAVIGVVLVLLGKWIALQGLLSNLPDWFMAILLIVPPVMGRWAMVLAAAGFPSARSTGSAAHFRQGFGRVQLIAATLITLAIVVVLIYLRVGEPGWLLQADRLQDYLDLLRQLGGPTILCLVVTPLVTAGIGRWASARLGGGLTGDVYGALCELVELTCLILLNLGLVRFGT